MSAPRVFRYRDATGQTRVFSGGELAAAVSVGDVPPGARVEVDGIEGLVAVEEAIAMTSGPSPAPPRAGATTAKIVQPVAVANVTPPTVPPPRSHKPTTLGLSDDVVIPRAPRPFRVPLPGGAAAPEPGPKKGQTVVMGPVAPPAPAPPRVAHGTRPMKPLSVPAPRATEVMPLGVDAPTPVGAPAPPRAPASHPPPAAPDPTPLFTPPDPPASVPPPAPPASAPAPARLGETPPLPLVRPTPLPPPPEGARSQRPLALASSKPTMRMEAFAPPPAPPASPPPPVEAPAVGLRVADEPAETAPDAPAEDRRKKLRAIVLGAVGAAAALGVVGIAAALLRRPSDPTPSPTQATSAAPPPASAAPAGPAASSAASPPEPPLAPREGALGACKVAKGAVKLAPRASKDIPLSLTGIPATSRIALGFSVDGKAPYGVEVDPTTLGVKKGAVPRAQGTLRRVFATPTGSGARWLVDADPKKASLRLAETVPVEPPFVVGVAGDVVATADKVTAAWAPGPRIRGNADLLRALTVSGAGSLVAVRASDTLFAVRLGADRAAKGDLVPLADGGQAGTPALGSNGVELAVAFAHRTGPTAPWGLMVSRFLRDDAPAKAAPFVVPAGGPGGDAFAPSIAGLADGRWLLAWTEGASGSRVVRVATLSASGAALGEPVALSVAKSNAGQPSLAVVGAEALAVYLTTPKKGSYEIWGATLSCR